MTTTSHQYQSDFARRYFSKGEAHAVLAVLNAREIHVPEDIRAQIAACTDLDRLNDWIRRAATARKIEDLGL